MIIAKRTLTKKYDAKHSVRFDEDLVPGQSKAVGTVYLNKEVAGDKQKITVTVEVG